MAMGDLNQMNDPLTTSLSAVPVAPYFASESDSIASPQSLGGDTALDTVDLRLRERANAMLSWMQPGLVYPAPWQCALSVVNRPVATDRAAFAQILSHARERIHRDFSRQHASVCVAFSFATWAAFCAQEGRAVPSGMRFAAETDFDGEPAVLARSGGVLQNSGIDVWFIVKADTEEAVTALSNQIEADLTTVGVLRDNVYRVEMHSRDNKMVPMGKPGGRVLGGRFQENLRNPASPVEIMEHVLVGDEDPASAGGSYIFTQRFNLNWAELHSKTPAEIDSVVGRHQYTDELIVTHDARSHIRSSHTYDARGNTIKLLRIGLPFGMRARADTGTPLIQHSGTASQTDESGIYFVGLARSADRIEAILESQFGQREADGFARDRLLGGSIARSDLGGFFYAPSLRELGATALTADAKARAKQKLSDWSRFPGVDWFRLNRHFDKRSDNRWMFYNHQDYLFAQGTQVSSDPDLPRPTSLRVQILLEQLFSKWDDTWFRAQKPHDLAPLRPQLIRFFEEPRNFEELQSLLDEEDDTTTDASDAERAANQIMQQPVAVRAGWAGRLLCNLASRLDRAGARGNGGMDTAQIHPLDLLAGSMPAQSLAEGHYLIDYAKDDDDEAERYRWFSMALGPNSGVGHVVPGYEQLLREGLAGLDAAIDAAEAALAADDRERAVKAAPFYAASRLAVRGLSEYLGNLADEAKALADALPAGKKAIEGKSLANLEVRLRWLAGGGAPRSVLEALQLVLSSHATLHLCGEPVAVGRLDRLIRPFVEREGGLQGEDLQEAIDCFWIKLGEKVLLNRIFIDDRQELGNLAMGNRAGPYPKGQSVNQWIQQVTVGGRNPDGTWEYSEATLACLRASAHLPFNAPVLSLRVGKDMPEKWRNLLLAEAAHGQMSGGASPILLNDDKIIPAMARSGDGIGPLPGSTSAALWNSKVREEDAHDYACDGCYEPQFVGANWFHLGGTILLQTLEYAINQGRQIQSAGPTDLFGKNMSFRSPAASEIGSYDEVEALFYKHFEWNYAKQMEGTVADFGRMQGVCPAPLLNLFINDCLSKGQDIYAGGARYNVFGPCFTSLANTINALWAIKTLCFDPETAVTTLPELVSALLSNWGETMIDPLVHPTILASDPQRVAQAATRFRHLREVALSLPRWGRGDPVIDQFGNAICSRIAELSVKVMTSPRPALAALYESAAARFGTTRNPFGGFCLQPGVGTFASYVEQGLGCAASADGRLSGQPLGTDMSPSPSPIDRPATEATQQRADAVTMLEGLTSTDSFGYANGAPIDLNIAESMSHTRLVEILEAFTNGAGSNVLTITVADQATFLSATNSPESYDLLRVRMGGWTEMFVAMHALHQKVHPRRPVSV